MNNNNSTARDSSNKNNDEFLKSLEQKYDITEAAIKQLDELASKEDTPIIKLLLESNLIPIEKLSVITNDSYGLNTQSLDQLDLAAIPTKYTNSELLEKYNAAPIYEKNGHLYVAVNNPNDFTSLSAYQFHLGINTQAVLMSNADIAKIKKHITTQLSNSALSNIDLGANLNNINSEPEDHKNNPLVKYVNNLILEAIKKKASDIHFEPYKDTYRIRFRNDGLLVEVANLPVSSAHQINSRLKIMANLDISEKRIPQDGRFNFIHNTKTYDFRMSTCPTLFGEKIVIRILDPSTAQIGIDELGYEEEQKEQFLTALKRSQGIILVTGPTGSGKTISLYTALNILNTNNRNISTAEDPVEIYLPGINQVQVNTKIGLTFATALRCFLRQDPDVMMVGEIRDLETAEIAIKAAQTGHLVLSTLHTNSAAETLNRLINMGLSSYNIATAINMIVAQRLIRRLCNHCKLKEELNKDLLIKEKFPHELINSAALETIQIYKANPNNCENCINGYSGRIGVYEAMSISKAMQEVILNGGSAIDIKKQAVKEHISSLRQAGLKKVIRGITSLSEVNRVTKYA